jgi:hypothetical protein
VGDRGCVEAASKRGEDDAAGERDLRGAGDNFATGDNPWPALTPTTSIFEGL